jgi:hypothetical protein
VVQGEGVRPFGPGGIPGCVQVKGVDLAPWLPHSTLCSRGVAQGYSDVASPGTASVVRDEEVWESSAIWEEALRAGAGVVSDGGGDGVGAKLVIFSLQSCNAGLVCCGAINEQPGGDLSHSAKGFGVPSFASTYLGDSLVKSILRSSTSCE